MTMFKYDWSRFDAKLGLIFMVGALVVFNLSSRFEFALFAAGISALLAWLTIVLVPGRRRSRHLLGLGVYLVVGVVLTWLADLVLSHGWLELVAMGIVTFAGYMMLLRGAHAFMVAWCLVYWYLLAPLPHHAFGGQTPDEVYFDLADRVRDRLKAARRHARRARMEANRRELCRVCAPPTQQSVSVINVVANAPP